MSKYYEMLFRVSDIPNKKVRDKIADAINAKWALDNCDSIEEMNLDNLVLYGRGHLYGGETEEDFAFRIAKTIWKAAGQYLPVEVVATYLEELPNESYPFNELDYNQWKEGDDG